ncbi:hypothetical protein EXIGLDRAFT_574308, partial [Exidia glandulosa HHB12029]
FRDHIACPAIIGPTLPRMDRPEARESYCKAMLMLFKPWRRFGDLKGEALTWDSAFLSFTFHPRSLQIMHNIAALHECKDASEAYRDLKRT